MRRLFLTLLLFLAVCAAAWPMGTESFGNKEALSELNYADYKGVMPLLTNTARVYRAWSDGGEWFYYRGNTEQLNEALRQFAAIEIPEHRVVFLPGKGTVQSFHGRRVPYDWFLEMAQGIPAFMLDASRPHYPFLTIHVNEGFGNINLKEVHIPKGIVVEDESDVRERCLRDLSNPNEGECVTAVFWLAGLGPVEDSDLAAIVDVVLHHSSQWVRACAAHALGRCGANAKPALPQLQKVMEDPDEQVKSCAREASEKIIADTSPPLSEDKERKRTLKRIAKLKKSQQM